jgi:Domain of unknown function (DUF4262)
MTHNHDDGCECVICSGEFDPDEFHDRIAEIIEEHDQYVMAVVTDDDNHSGDHPFDFVYSIGNTGRGLPELLMLGNMDFHVMGGVLNDLGRLMRERGRPFDDGEVVPTGGRLPVKVINAGSVAGAEYACWAGDYYQTDAVRVQQVLVPDTDGRFPGEPGCAGPFSEVPVLVETKQTVH